MWASPGHPSPRWPGGPGPPGRDPVRDQPCRLRLVFHSGRGRGGAPVRSWIYHSGRFVQTSPSLITGLIEGGQGLAGHREARTRAESLTNLATDLGSPSRGRPQQFGQRVKLQVYRNGATLIGLASMKNSTTPSKSALLSTPPEFRITPRRSRALPLLLRQAGRCIPSRRATRSSCFAVVELDQIRSAGARADPAGAGPAGADPHLRGAASGGKWSGRTIGLQWVREAGGPRPPGRPAFSPATWPASSQPPRRDRGHAGGHWPGR